MLGESKSKSRERILSVLAKLAQIEPGMLIAIMPEPDVPFSEVEECAVVILSQGFREVWLPDCLWISGGVTERRR